MPSEAIEDDVVAIGTIVLPPADAGVIFATASDTVGGTVDGRLPTEGSLELIAGEGVESVKRGVMVAEEIGFFVNLWRSDNDDGGMTDGVNVAFGRVGSVEGLGGVTSGETGAAGRWMRLWRRGVSVSPARAGTMNAIVKSHAHEVMPAVDLVWCENCGVVTSARSCLGACCEQ